MFGASKKETNDWTKKFQKGKKTQNLNEQRATKRRPITPAKAQNRHQHRRLLWRDRTSHRPAIPWSTGPVVYHAVFEHHFFLQTLKRFSVVSFPSVFALPTWSMMNVDRVEIFWATWRVGTALAVDHVLQKTCFTLWRRAHWKVKFGIDFAG